MVRETWLTIVVAGTAALGVVGTAWADWDPGDGHKMHFPQMPDPDGWDVSVMRDGDYPGDIKRVVADDWKCSEAGPVTDIHFWGSWRDDLKGDIEWIHVGIWSDDRSGSFSKPGQELWFQSFHPTEWTERFWGTGDQGWYDPATQTVVRPDHMNTYQYNITGINVPGAFEQVAGEIYWLSIQVELFAGTAGEFGWKSSLDHFEDDAVWVDMPTTGTIPWQELYDPDTGISMDMAFVITPSPSAGALLLLGSLAVGARRRR